MDGEELGLLDAGADAGGSDVAGLADEGAPEEVETPAAGDDGRPDDAAPKEGEEAKPGDARTISGKWREAIAKVKESDPALAKELSRAYWKVQQLDKLGSTQELTSLKEAVELHGGLDGIQELAGEVEAARALDSGFEKGDPAIIEGMVRDFPDGFKKLMVPALNKWAELANEDYSRAIGSAAYNTFDQNGTIAAVAQLGEVIKASGDANAIRNYDKLVDTLIKFRDYATKAKEDPYADRARQLDEREQGIQKAQREAFEGGVKGEVNNLRVKLVNSQLATQLKGRKLDANTRNRVMSAISADLSAQVHKDTVYQRQYASVMNSNDREKAIKHMVTWSERTIPNIVRGVLKDFQLLGAAPGARPNPAARVTPGAPAVTQGTKPKVSEVDFRRSDMATFLGQKHGTVWLKSGKQMKF